MMSHEELLHEYRLYVIRSFFQDLDNLIDAEFVTFEEFCKKFNH